MKTYLKDKFVPECSPPSWPDKYPYLLTRKKEEETSVIRAFLCLGENSSVVFYKNGRIMYSTINPSFRFDVDVNNWEVSDKQLIIENED